MDNYLLMKRTEELEELSKKLGFVKTYFLDSLNIIKTDNKKDFLKKIVKGKVNIYEAPAEDMLRFALERTKVDIVMGMETVHPKDSLHFLRAGLDQVLCKIAHENGKIVAFSFSEILDSTNQAGLIARMQMNIRLCRKYKVKMLFSNFSRFRQEIKSAGELETFWRVLNNRGKS